MKNELKNEFYSFIQNMNKKVFTREEIVTYLRRNFPLDRYSRIEACCNDSLKRLLDANCIRRINRGEYEIIKL